MVVVLVVLVLIIFVVIVFASLVSTRRLANVDGGSLPLRRSIRKTRVLLPEAAKEPVVGVEGEAVEA